MDLGEFRLHYDVGTIDAASMHVDPTEQWRLWFEAAVENDVFEPNAMVVATVDEGGWPHARNVLAKGVDERADVYSIGKLLWLLSSAVVPPQHPENGDLDVSGVRDPWKILVETAVQTNPEDRFQSIAEMKAVGHEIIAGCE